MCFCFSHFSCAETAPREVSLSLGSHRSSVTLNISLTCQEKAKAASKATQLAKTQERASFLSPQLPLSTSVAFTTKTFSSPRVFLFLLIPKVHLHHWHGRGVPNYCLVKKTIVLIPIHQSCQVHGAMSPASRIAASVVLNIVMVHARWLETSARSQFCKSPRSCRPR